MKNIKKIGALLLAVVMIMAMSTTAFADGEALTAHDGTETSNEVVRILKEITAYNPDDSTVNEPTATYTYSIAAGSADVSVTDEDGVTAVTYAGDASDVTMKSQTNSTAAATTTLSYVADGTNTLTTEDTGHANTKWVDIDFSAVDFGGPGIYRYTITETATTYNGSNGVVYAGETSGANAGKNIRYLDVYVKASASYDGTQGADDWDVYGYAMFTTDSTHIYDDSDTTNGNETTLYKTTGFVADSTNSVAADSYYTFNVTITKTVANDTYVQALHTQFPFTVSFANATVTANVLPTVDDSNSYADDGSVALATGNINSITGNAALKPTIGHQGEITYIGLPSGTSITVSEDNNIQNVTYTVTQTSADASFTTSTIAYGENSGDATVAAQTVGTTNVDKTVAFTNTLALISPTGVVLRVAPFAIMLCAGIVLLLFTRRRKKDEEEYAMA